MYRAGLVKNVILAKTLFPGWSFRIYHDGAQPIEKLSRVGEEQGVAMEWVDMSLWNVHDDSQIGWCHDREGLLAWKKTREQQQVHDTTRKEEEEEGGAPASGGPAAGMFWRMFVADDPRVDISINIDSDARLSPRLAAAVAEWAESAQLFHILRDSRWHDHPINGGMWGCKRGCLETSLGQAGPNVMETRSRAWLRAKPAEYLSDMIFLAAEVRGSGV